MWPGREVESAIRHNPMSKKYQLTTQGKREWARFNEMTGNEDNIQYETKG
jgi:hypothetical protein